MAGTGHGPSPVGSKALRFAVVGLAALVVALGAWVAFGPRGGATVPAGVEALIEDYLAAWEARDIDALEAITTSDFVVIESIYTTAQDLTDPEKVTLSGRFENDLRALRVSFADESLPVDHQVEQVGDYLVSGDGPWVVSVEEIWADATISARSLGIASYVIVEDGGALRIAEHLWAGLRGWEGLDE